MSQNNAPSAREETRKVPSCLKPLRPRTDESQSSEYGLDEHHCDSGASFFLPLQGPDTGSLTVLISSTKILLAFGAHLRVNNPTNVANWGYLFNPSSLLKRELSLGIFPIWSGLEDVVSTQTPPDSKVDALWSS